MGDWGFKIKKQSVNKDVEDCDPKELVFSSEFPCLKILQTGKRTISVSNSSSPTYTESFTSEIDFPAVILVFLYDPGDSSYKALGSENIQDHTQNYRGKFYFDTTDLYVQVENYTGSDIDTHFIYFIGYA